jgi:hypothetical protein
MNLDEDDDRAIFSDDGFENYGYDDDSLFEDQSGEGQKKEEETEEDFYFELEWKEDAKKTEKGKPGLREDSPVKKRRDKVRQFCLIIQVSQKK